MKCPIKGCNHDYAYGIAGWDSHVASAVNHEHWHPSMDGEERKAAFQREFPRFFDQAARLENQAPKSQVHRNGKRRASGEIQAVRSKKAG